MTTPCALPGCPIPADTRNRTGQAVCVDHRAVVVASDAPDGKHDDAGGDW